MLKRFFSVLLVSLFIISLIPFSSLADKPVAQAEAPGGAVTTPEELASALGSSGIVIDGNVITVVRDVVLSSTVSITEGSYIIIGEGASITGSFDGDLFSLSGEGTTLTLGDISEVENDSDLVFDGGSTVRNGSIFRIEKGAVLEMYSSVHIKNAATSASGAAVYNDGEFTMYGGEIRGCRASSSGGAIYNKGSLTLASGDIDSCSANDGGAIYNEGEVKLIATSVTGCNATKGGAIYNSGELEFNAAEVTECTATKGGAIYNSGKAVIKGGTVNKNKSESGDGEGGGVYNTAELEISGSVIRENTAKNGGNIYNSGTVTTGEAFILTGGVASVNGGNVYNAGLGIFTQTTGAVTLGSALHGGGIFNLGTYNLGAGVYANKAKVGEGILNHGRLVLSGTGYCEKGDDIFVVLTPENKHAIVVAENWNPNIKVTSISCGSFDNGPMSYSHSYSYSHSAGNKLLDIKGEIKAGSRFCLHVSGTGLIVNDNGSLAKAPTPVSDTVITVICVILAYPLVTAGIVFAIRYFDKKKLA